MSTFEHGNDKTTIANAVAATARSTRFDTRNMPTVVLEIATTGFSGTIVFNASSDVGANWTTDNLTYLPRSGMAPTNSTLSYTTDTSRKQYLIPDPGEAISANITRTAGSVTIITWTVGQTVQELGAATASTVFNDSEGDPAQVSTAASDGTSVYPARRDHVHKYEAATVRFSNAGDNDKKIQIGQTSHAFAAVTTKVVAVTFSTAFANTPRVVATPSAGSNVTMPYTTAITTTGFSLTLIVPDIAPPGTGGTAISSTETADWVAIG